MLLVTTRMGQGNRFRMPDNFNDERLTAFTVATGLTGNVSDLEMAWLAGKGAAADSLNDRWGEYLDSVLVPAGQLNDRLYSWLTGLGYLEPQLNEKLLAMYKSGLPV